MHRLKKMDKFICTRGDEESITEKWSGRTGQKTEKTELDRGRQRRLTCMSIIQI